MAGEIKVNYDVIDQIVDNINALADQTLEHATGRDELHRSRGVVATRLQESSDYIGQFVQALADVMRLTANQIKDAEAKMREADETAASQYEN